MKSSLPWLGAPVALCAGILAICPFSLRAGVEVQKIRAITSGEEAAHTSTTFDVSTATAGDYLVIVALNETNCVATITLDGEPMTTLVSNQVDGMESTVAMYGIQTSRLTGSVQINYTDKVFGSQAFAYIFLSGVDGADPVYTTASAGGSEEDSKSKLELKFGEISAKGALAITGAYINFARGIVQFSPAMEQEGKIDPGSTFNAGVAVSAINGSTEERFTVEVDFLEGGRRINAAGIVIRPAEEMKSDS